MVSASCQREVAILAAQGALTHLNQLMISSCPDPSLALRAAPPTLVVNHLGDFLLVKDLPAVVFVICLFVDAVKVGCWTIEIPLTLWE